MSFFDSCVVLGLLLFHNGTERMVCFTLACQVCVWMCGVVVVCLFLGGGAWEALIVTQFPCDRKKGERKSSFSST